MKNRTRTDLILKLFNLTFLDLIMQLSMLFQMLTDDLNMKQINFLNALLPIKRYRSPCSVYKKISVRHLH
jgi:hypothetical protein